MSETKTKKLIEELKIQIEEGENENVLEILNKSILNLKLKKVLKITPKDEKILYCKVIALIKNENYTGAIEFIEKEKMQKLVFEKAYCLYRLEKLDESTIVLENIKNEDLNPKVFHLKSQIVNILLKKSFTN
jgi:signal recognition particle subunit SRP72